MVDIPNQSRYNEYIDYIGISYTYIMKEKLMDKRLMSISITMLVLKLLSEQDMYGYQLIKELDRRSENVFTLKEGTLYPVLHSLEEKFAIESYEMTAETGRLRKYYHLTDIGLKLLDEKSKEWKEYQNAISGIMKGGILFG